MQTLLTVTSLHISEHYFIQFKVCLPQQACACTISFRRNLQNLIQNDLLFTFPPLRHRHFHLLAPSRLLKLMPQSLCSALSSCLDPFCSLSTRTAQSTRSDLWLNESLRFLRGNGTELNNPSDLTQFQALPSSFLFSVTAAKRLYHDNIYIHPLKSLLFLTYLRG